MAIAREKIALAVPSFSGGGAERVMVILANKFIEFGYSVDFIVGLDKGPYKKLLSKEVNKIVLAEESQGRVTKRFSAVSVLRRYLRDSDSFVLMSTIREFNVFVGFVKVFSRSKKHVFFREAASLDDSHFSGSWPKKIKLFLMRYFYKRVDGIIANSNATRDDLKKYLSLDGAKIASIYNPLDKVQCLSKKVSIKIVAAGRLVPNKNFPDLIKSLPHVKEKYPDVTLDILGQGAEKENLQKLIDELGLAESVKLVGFVDNPYEYYAAASVFVQTSLWEGFGYVLAEAMACGTPVVAYDSKGAMREILADGKYGLLTPVGDLQALANAIIQQIENPTSTELLKEAVARFDVDKIAREYLNALGVK